MSKASSIKYETSQSEKTETREKIIQSTIYNIRAEWYFFFPIRDVRDSQHLRDTLDNRTNKIANQLNHLGNHDHHQMESVVLHDSSDYHE